jgi:hypothetical protein
MWALALLILCSNHCRQFFMIWYHLIFSDNKKAVGYAWNLMGFVAKLAQGVCAAFVFNVICLGKSAHSGRRP